MTMDHPRHVERKYICAAGEAHVILAWLEHACLPDPRYPRAVVSSIYFDTPDLAFYREKLNGDYLRWKVRLRWYLASEAADRAADRVAESLACFLEVKRKEGSVTRKHRVALPLPRAVFDGDPFADGELCSLGDRAGELGCSPPGPLVPTILVRYHRGRWLDPRSLARLSLDSGISCTHANAAVVPAAPPVHLGIVVLETKGGDAAIARSLGPLAGRLARDSFSKYAACLEALVGDGARRPPA